MLMEKLDVPEEEGDWQGGVVEDYSYAIKLVMDLPGNTLVDVLVQDPDDPGKKVVQKYTRGRRYKRHVDEAMAKFWEQKYGTAFAERVPDWVHNSGIKWHLGYYPGNNTAFQQLFKLEGWVILPKDFGPEADKAARYLLGLFARFIADELQSSWYRVEFRNPDGARTLLNFEKPKKKA